MDIVIIFAIGWVASHAFSEKRDEYSASQEAHREKYLRKLDKHHPSWGRARREQYLRNAARRNALGHFAYLLRHGWSSTFNDFHDGWKNARKAHDEWKAERERNGERAGALTTLKEGWRRRWAQRPKAVDYDDPYSLRPSKPTSEPAAKLSPEPITEETPRPAAAPATPSPGGESTAGATVLRLANRTPQAPGTTAGRTNRSTAVTEFNYDRTRTEMNGIGDYATSKLSVLEQIIADAIAGDMNRDTETMSNLANLQEALSNAHAYASAVASSMTKHTGGQEYANTGHAAKTDYLKSN